MKDTIQSMKKLLTASEGFSLLEVVVAASILTVGLLAIATLQGAAIKGNNSAATNTIAATVATDRMEKLMALDMNSQQLQDSDNDGQNGLSDTGADADHAVTGQVISGKSFNIFWNVAEDTPNAGNKTIGLVVTWNDRGRTRALEITQVR